MFVATLTLAFIVAHVAAEIPSYIHVCGRRNPNLDECIMKSVDNLKDKICDGIPELNVESANPLHIEQINIVNSGNARISLNDVYVSGLCDYNITSFHFNLEKMHVDIETVYRRIDINMMYNFNASLLVPIVFKGSMHAGTDNVFAKVSADFKKTIKNGKEYVYMSNMDLKLDIKGYEADFEPPNEGDLGHLRQIGQDFLGSSQKEILSVLEPIVEDIIVKQILKFSNNIVKHFTYDELFPDRE